MNIKDLRRGDYIQAYLRTEHEWIGALVVRTYESGGSPGVRLVGVTKDGTVADFHIKNNSDVGVLYARSEV